MSSLGRLVRWVVGAAVVIGLLRAGSLIVHQTEVTSLDLSQDGCLVLCYHRVVPRRAFRFDPREGIAFGIPAAQDDYTLYADVFREQLRGLKSGGAQFITANQLEGIVRRQDPPPSRCVLITLDDGDVSQYENAFPILKEEQVPFTIFVITEQIGAKNFNGLEIATWQQIREMIASGFGTVGSHTHNLHYAERSGQPSFLRPENAAAFAQDLQASIRMIQQETGTVPVYFAYPYGFGIPATDEAALQQGMRLLFTLRPGLVSPGDPAFYIKRLMVTPRNWHLVVPWVSPAEETSVPASMEPGL